MVISQRNSINEVWQLVFCLVLLLSTGNTVSSANLEQIKAMKARTDLEVWAIAVVSKAVVFLIVEKEGKYSFGTGVLLNHKNKTSVVTNRHIVEGSSECIIGFSISQNKPGFIMGRIWNVSKQYDLAEIALTYDKKKAKLHMHRFQDQFRGTVIEDLINLDQFITRHRISGIYSASITTDAFANPHLLVPGKNTYFLGYPLSIGWTERTPVVRKGILATRPSRDGIFLIDAMVNHGNSGSPVFVEGYSSGEYAWKLCGIVSSYKPDYVNYKSKSNHVISLPHNSGLATVISMDAIINFLDNP